MMNLNTVADKSALSNKATLVKLTVRRANLSRRDAAAEAIIQNTMDDTSLTVVSKLFRDKSNPVNAIISKASEVYTYHKANTLAYIDKGPRLLPNTNYFDYTSNMRQRINDVDALIAKHMPYYDQYVLDDIRTRTTGTNKTISALDYPTAVEFQARMGFDLRFSPLPEAKHFLFDLNEDDLKAFQDAEEQLAGQVRTEVIDKMMEPLKHLVDKLQRPIGTTGAIFRDSAVENILEGVKAARKLNVANDPDIETTAKALEVAVSVFDTNKDVLRESPIVREQAAQKLEHIAKQMGAFFGATP